MHPCEQASITERSEFVEYFMQYGLERRGTQATLYPKRFTHLNLKGFTWPMPWRSIPFSTCDENEYIKLIVVLISHTRTLSLTPL